MSSCKTGQTHVPCQYCGSVEHSSQVAICPICKTKNHSPLYICPLLKKTKSQEKDYKDYKSDNPFLGYHKVSYEIRGDVGNIQVSLVAAPSHPW